MKYMGSKKKLAKHLLPIILDGRKPGQWYVEPFVGGGNIIDQVEAWTPEGTNGSPRLGADVNPYIIALLRAVRNGWVPPQIITEAEYAAVKAAPAKFEAHYAAFVMFGCSFGSNWGNGYGREQYTGPDGVTRWRGVAEVTRRTLLKQAPLWKHTEFVCSEFHKLGIPKGAIVYCDPPYSNATGYKGTAKFDHEIFWTWCDSLVNRGHKVFVSEYLAPAHWTPVWERPVHNSLDFNSPHERKGDKRKIGTEKLFIHRAFVCEAQ